MSSRRWVASTAFHVSALPHAHCSLLRRPSKRPVQLAFLLSRLHSSFPRPYTPLPSRPNNTPLPSPCPVSLRIPSAHTISHSPSSLCLHRPTHIVPLSGVLASDPVQLAFLASRLHSSFSKP